MGAEKTAPGPTEVQAIIGNLLQFDDTSLLQLIGTVLTNNPHLSPGIMSIAVPDLTYAPTRGLTERRSSGTISKVGPYGGSIACPELQAVFGNEVVVGKNQLGSFSEGQQVTFAVLLTEENKPQAFDLLVAESAAAGRPAASTVGAASTAGVGGMGGMAGMPGMGAMAGMGGGMMGAGMGGMGGCMGTAGMGGCMGAAGMGMGMGMGGGMAGMAGMGGVGGSAGMAGMAGMAGGDLSALGMAGVGGVGAMGGMAGLGGLGGMGVGGMAGMSGMGMAGMGVAGMAGMANASGMQGLGGGMGTDQLLGEFLGIVRSINEEGGFGFIASDMLKSQGVTEDAYVHKHYLETFSVGSEVSFTAFLDGRNGRPRAKDLKDATGKVGQQASAGNANRGDQVVLGSYVGTIKSYNAIKGFGFITCQELNNKGHTGDVYLHQKHAQNSPFNVGDTVSFTAYLHAGRLQGRDLSEPGAPTGPAAKRMRLDAGSPGAGKG